MIKATKKELEKALDIVCREKWIDCLPNGECERCKAYVVDCCMKCWKELYINLAKEELKNE